MGVLFLFKLKKINGIKKNNLLFCALFLCSSFVFGFLGGSLANVMFSSSESGDISIETISTETVGSGALSPTQIVAMVEDSVVEIQTKIVSNGRAAEGAGSGIIVREDGYIATNAHVVEGARSISVTLHNDKVYTAKLVGKNEEEDVAVLKIEAKGLNAVTFANSDDIKVGENVLVIGNALGTLDGSVTDGIVSAVNRTINVNGDEMTLIQTDAEINHGNSGGGMFGSTGLCLGIIVAKSTGDDVEGLGFAIPANVVKNVVDGFLANV